MICPLGVSTHDSWEKMLTGQSGISKITVFDASDCVTQIGGQLPQEAYIELEKNTLPRKLCQQAVFPSRVALLCAHEALEDSGINLGKLDRKRCAVISGSGGSNLLGQYDLTDKRSKKVKHAHEMVNAIPAWISFQYGLKGPALNIATACASGGYAIGAGFEYITSGKVDMCLAIGIDIMLLKESIDGFNQLYALSEENTLPEKASKPFDKNRSGFVLSEGGCALVLESCQHAVQRGARIYAVLSGYGMTSEAFNIFAPESSGKEMAKTMERAIQRAGVLKEDIGYVNAHGTSTPHNDLCETTAIKHVFGEHAYTLAVSSQKSMIGHTIGGAGALECAVTALSLYHQILTPTINYETPDPQCDLDYVPNQSRPLSALKAAISNSFGFGGHNSSIVLERFAQ
jgi:3-oxoacyl-[acyl-carrier-protein] synthase II